MHVLADEVDQLVGVLAGGGDPDRPGPVEVHVAQLVGELLDLSGPEHGQPLLARVLLREMG